MGDLKIKNCILCKLANLIQILVVFRLHAEGSNPWDSSAYEQKLTSLQPVSNQVFVLLVGGGGGGAGVVKWVGRQFQIIMKRSRPSDQCNYSRWVSSAITMHSTLNRSPTQSFCTHCS